MGEAAKGSRKRARGGAERRKRWRVRESRRVMAGGGVRWQDGAGAGVKMFVAGDGL